MSEESIRVITNSEPTPQEFIVIHKSEDPSASGKSVVDKIEQGARIFSIIAIPILLAFVASYFQDSASKRTVSSEYVQIAINIITSKEDVDPELKDWAIDLLAQNSPTPLSVELVKKLKSGEANIPELTISGYKGLDENTANAICSSLVTAQLPDNTLSQPRWTRYIANYNGTLCQAYLDFVVGSVAMTWPEFEDLVVEYNENLNSPSDRLEDHRAYILPQTDQ